MGTYYKNCEQYIDRIDRGAWVELGVDRGEGSTRWFSELAKTKATRFYGVDMDPDQISRAQHNLAATGQAIIQADGSIQMQTGALADHVSLITDRGEEFLKKLENKEQISLIYLDNFDWDYWLGREEESFVAGIKQRYRDTMQIEMTNINSQITHLLQAIHAMPMMTPNSLIICDDTWAMPDEGIFSGKCSAVIPYALLNGYKILHTSGHRQNSGVILGRFKK